MAAILEYADNNLTLRMRTLLNQLWVEWRQLEYDVETASEEIDDEAQPRAFFERTIPGTQAVRP